jgi:hypothetical protein
MNSFVIDDSNPRILCLSEHHMEEQDLNLQKGGVCILLG